MDGDAVNVDELRLPLVAEASDGSAACGDGGGGEPGGGQRSGTTFFGTCFNVLNIYVGTGLLGMHYAMMRGGWAALAAQALLIPIFAFSGRLIVSSFEFLPPHTPQTYPELGKAAAGAAGLRAVMLFSFLELFGGSCILIMVAWQQLELLLPTEGLGPLLSSMHWVAAVATLLLLPLLFVDLKRLSRLSMVGLSSSGMVIALVLALLGLDPHRTAMPQQPPPTHHSASVGIIQAIGVFSLSATAHSTLPALRTAMRQPAHFPAALAASFGAMLAAYSTLAAVGYWYFGDGASPLITTDLAHNSWYSTHASVVPVHRILAGFVLVNTLTKYPGLNLCLQDMILSVLPLDRDALGEYHPPLHWAARLLRLALFCAATVLALTAYSVLGSALSLLGGLGSITCSLLLPTAFYARLAWRRLRTPARAGLLALLFLGAALVCLITSTNVCDMLERCRAWHSEAAAAHEAIGGSAAWGWAGPLSGT